MNFNNITFCYYLKSHVDGHIIRDGGHFIRWPPFYMLNQAYFMKTSYIMNFIQIIAFNLSCFKHRKAQNVTLLFVNNL